MSDEAAVQVAGITKNFGAVRAVDGVDWLLRRGEVHALLGENGAGKSTLCSILAGVYRPDDGRILVGGEEQSFGSPRDALAAGIGMVFQDFRLLKALTVAENLALATPDSATVLRRRAIERSALAAAERFGIAIDPAARVADLSIGEQQRVEILRLLLRDPSVVVLDEPTSVLTPQESAALLETMRGLASGGCAVVLVSHKLDEVYATADRITVLRDGRCVAEASRGELEPRELARLMVGREIHAVARASVGPGRDSVLSIRDLSAFDDRGQVGLKSVSFEVYRGEILGIAGVAGNGQRELAETIAGLRPAMTGSIRWGTGSEIVNLSVRERVELGIAYVPDDRMGTAIAEGLPPWVSLSLRDFNRPEYSRGPFLRMRKLRANAERLAQEFHIRGHIANGQARHLSGGNVQRLVLARELEHRPIVMVAAYPTRGLDVGAVAAIHQLLLEQCAAGMGVVMISEDLDELLSICDRILVLFEGAVTGECVPGQVDIAAIGAMMAGHRSTSVHDGDRPPSSTNGAGKAG